MNEMAKTDKVLSRKEGGVGYVVFNNPERHNAMSLDMWAATGRIMEEFARDDALRVVVLTGAGSKAFVSGADISRFGAERSNEEAVAHYNETVEKASRALHNYPEAHHRDDPRLLHRRRPRHRDVLRPAHRDRAIRPSRCRPPSSASATAIPA